MSGTNKLNLAPFDASDYLDNEEVIAEYLTVALEDPDPDAFLMAVRDVAKARGIATVAAGAGVGRGGGVEFLRYLWLAYHHVAVPVRGFDKGRGLLVVPDDGVP